ncbi:hypothetical protein CMO83_02885 [Candidatus Woesearchaeota archaeon]|nr:hypothetical protein [Candidatus Woesearchaeota archaeon]
MGINLSLEATTSVQTDSGGDGSTFLDGLTLRFHTEIRKNLKIGNTEFLPDETYPVIVFRDAIRRDDNYVYGLITNRRLICEGWIDGTMTGYEAIRVYRRPDGRVRFTREDITKEFLLNSGEVDRLIGLEYLTPINSASSGEKFNAAKLFDVLYPREIDPRYTHVRKLLRTAETKPPSPPPPRPVPPPVPRPAPPPLVVDKRPWTSQADLASRGLKLNVVYVDGRDVKLQYMDAEYLRSKKRRVGGRRSHESILEFHPDDVARLYLALNYNTKGDLTPTMGILMN